MNSSNSKYVTRNGKTSKRGAFINGIWHCDCDIKPRLPADKFQTKNGGKNHGRWFYTCQKPQHQRCNFFLWADDAKVREESAVLSNSRSEPPRPPQTPRKNTTTAVPPTPSSRARPTPTKQDLPRKPALVTDDDEFDSFSSADEELAQALEIYETPRKAARTAQITSPGKRDPSARSIRTTSSDASWLLAGDVFTTPSASNKPTSIPTGLLSPTHTLVQRHSQPFSQLDPDSSLATQALQILQPANLSSHIEKDLTDLLEKYELRSQGISKGRDITRLGVQAKDRKIAELQARIQGLEAEREISKTVINHLKQDMATSPKKAGGAPGRGGRKSEGFQRRRSEV
jgi:GRF zinc finger